MLARRFTIVCLLISLFGMLFAVLVVEAGRPTRPWEAKTTLPCLFGGLNCEPSIIR